MANNAQHPLDVVPGVCLGPFKLGDTLWHTINLLSSKLKSEYTAISVAWADKTPGVLPVTLRIHQPPLDLLFSGTSQQLIAIELTKDAQSHLQYKGALLSQDGSPISEKTIQRAFGPTFSPSLRRIGASATCKEAKLNAVCYPGVVFTFASAGKLEMVTVFNSGSWKGAISRATDVFDNLLNFNLPVKRTGVNLVSVELPTENTQSLVAMISFPDRDPLPLELGYSTAEDIFATFGTAQARYEKEDQRLNIHSNGSGNDSTDQETATPDYFLNYFDLGIDLLMDGTRHTLKKIVLHSNNPGETLFGRYERCSWQIHTDKQTACSSTDTIKKISEFSRLAAPKGDLLKKDALNSQGFTLDRTADAQDDLQVSKPTRVCSVLQE